jgi:hypothetical protein
MNKSEFVSAVLAKMQKYPWAADPEKWAKAKQQVEDNVFKNAKSCLIDGPAWVDSWKEAGLKGKPTYKGIAALPE